MFSAEDIAREKRAHDKMKKHDQHQTGAAKQWRREVLDRLTV
jgi:hypothetical protein